MKIITGRKLQTRLKNDYATTQIIQSVSLNCGNTIEAKKTFFLLVIVLTLDDFQFVYVFEFYQNPPSSFMFFVI